MTRPMPGPHQHDDGWHYDCTACSGLWDRGDEAQRLDKHLTDAEVAAEFWSATARAQFFAWAPNRLLGIDTPADGNPCHTTRPDPYPHWDEAETWRRFATHPHAFKENP